MVRCDRAVPARVTGFPKAPRCSCRTGALRDEDRRALPHLPCNGGERGLRAAFRRARIDGFVRVIENVVHEPRFGAAGKQVVADDEHAFMLAHDGSGCRGRNRTGSSRGMGPGRLQASLRHVDISPSASIPPNSTGPQASVARRGSPLQKTITFWCVRPSLREAVNWRPARIGSEPTAVTRTASL